MTAFEFDCQQSHPGGFTFDVSFTTTGRVTALFGPSGSGKTTAIEMIAGLRRPDRGRITLDANILTDAAAGVHFPPHRRNLGVVFQDQLLFPHLSVESNLRFGNRRGAGPITLDRVVTVLDLAKMLPRRPRNLSGGEKQRVALGRALLSHPKLLLMDEPLTGLDDAMRHRILDYVERIVEEWSLPAIYVSHNQADVRRLADWAVVLDGGRVVSQGPPEASLATPAAMTMNDATGPQNVVRLERVENREGNWSGAIGVNLLHLPAASAGYVAPLYVHFSPDDVVLTQRDLTGVSARNQWHGQVAQIVEASHRVFVAIDVGQIVWAEVTPGAARELELAKGSRVTCVVKTNSLRVW